MLVWLLGTAALVLIGEIPTSTAGHVARGALMFPAVLIGVIAIRRLRGSLVSTMGPPPSEEPVSVSRAGAQQVADHIRGGGTGVDALSREPVAKRQGRNVCAETLLCE